MAILYVENAEATRSAAATAEVRRAMEEGAKVGAEVAVVPIMDPGEFVAVVEEGDTPRMPPFVGALMLGAIRASRVRVTALLDQVAGPLPRSATITTYGGPVLFIASGSGVRSSAGGALPGPIRVELRVDGSAIATLRIYANTLDAHLSLVPVFPVRALAAGSHPVELVQVEGSASGLDFFTVTALELPL